MRVILASASPRRLDLLRAAGVDPEVRPADVDERARAGERPADLALRLARAKADAVADPLWAAGGAAGIVLAADTVVAVDGEVFGKPRDDGDATRMLARLAGRWHEVHTGVAIVDVERGTAVSGVATTEVAFAPLDAADVAAYVATGEGRDKAGAYAVQGQARRFVREVRGSYTNVVGLPMELVDRLLKTIGRELRRAAGIP